MAALKNSKHEAFALGVHKGAKPRDAYRAAGYDCSDAAADSAASRLLKNVEVQGRISELKELIIERALITKDVLEQKVWDLAKMAEAEKQLNVAKGCYELLGRDRGVFTEQKRVTVHRSIQDVPLEELEEFLANSAAGFEETPRRGRAN